MANDISRAQRSHEVYASAARTATPDTQELELPGGVQYVTAVLDVTAANEVANVAVPPVIRFTVTHGDADSATYSVGAHFS